MDVERVQKINTLALDLMNQGLVQEREEAVKQAEEILSKEDYSSLSETMEEVKEISLTEGGEKKEELGKEKINEILEKNTVFIVGKMKKYQEQMEEFKEEVRGLRKEVGRLKNNMDNLKIKHEEACLKVKEEPQQRLAEAKSESSAEDHPRSGKFDDNAVSIEKFFYSGSRPKD